MTKKMAGLKIRVSAFREHRLEKDALEASIKKEQPELVSALHDAGITNERGLVYDSSDDSKGAAYVQHNEAGTFWNETAIITYLRKKKPLWMACSTRVLDIQKFEAEVAAGNIPPKVAARFKERGDRPNPFIRFGKINEKSVE